MSDLVSLRYAAQSGFSIPSKLVTRRGIDGHTDMARTTSRTWSRSALAENALDHGMAWEPPISITVVDDVGSPPTQYSMPVALRSGGSQSSPRGPSLTAASSR